MILNTVTSAHKGQAPLKIGAPFQMMRVVGEWTDDGQFVPVEPRKLIGPDGNEYLLSEILEKQKNASA